jgi:hypothetical protein
MGHGTLGPRLLAFMNDDSSNHEAPARREKALPASLVKCFFLGFLHAGLIMLPMIFISVLMIILKGIL